MDKVYVTVLQGKNARDLNRSRGLQLGQYVREQEPVYRRENKGK